jgi:hypothetical protein
MENKFTPDVILYDESGNVDEIRKTLASIYGQKWAPHCIWILINSEIDRLVGTQLLLEAPSGFTWHIIKIKQADMEFGAAIDHLALSKRNWSKWLSVIYSGEEYPRDFFEKTQTLLEGGERFVLLVDRAWYVVLSSLNKYIGGHGGVDLEEKVSGDLFEKIAQVCAEQGKGDYIKESKTYWGES